MVFLRNAQVAAVDDQLRSLVSNDVASSLLDVEIDDGIPGVYASFDSAIGHGEGHCRSGGGTEPARVTAEPGEGVACR